MKDIIDNTAYYEAQGYRFYGGHTFKYYSTKLSWPNAKTACEAMGGHLAVSNTAEKNVFLTGLIEAVSWLGATDEVTEGSWKWITGDAWSYSNWDAPQPDNAGEAEHYLELYLTGKWNDLPAATALTFICEWDYDLRFMSDYDTLDFIQSNDYAFHNGHTFKYIDKASTWTEAKTLCEAIGGHLATSTSEEKNTFLRGLAAKIMWLGATDAEEEGHWKWVNGEEWNYTNWSEGEPNNQGEEHCLQFYANGMWNDYSGATPYTYICEWDFDLRTLMIRNHEGLNNVMGGTVSEHYHLSKDERKKLLEVLDILYPDGADTPVFPSAPAPSTPELPDTPVEPSQPTQTLEPSSGLPETTPPEWQINLLPSGYNVVSGAHKMYYGQIPKKENKAIITGLIVPMMKTSSTKSKALVYTQDLTVWKQLASLSTNTYGINTEYVCISRPQMLWLCMLGYPSIGKNIYNKHVYTKNTNNSTYASTLQYANNSKATSWLAGCCSPSMNIYLFASADGHIYRAYADANDKIKGRKENISCGIPVNPGCAAWSTKQQVFCLAGANGTATSSSGDNWKVSTDAPHDLRDLTYREDIEAGVFLAWSNENKLFYISRDGSTWTRYSDTPIPLDKVSSLAYNPELGWYCAIGVTDARNSNTKDDCAYFSKNLNSWVKTQVTSSAVEMGSVIWAGGQIKRFIILPASGATYFTFNPMDWS